MNKKDWIELLILSGFVLILGFYKGKVDDLTDKVDIVEEKSLQWIKV